MLFLAACGGGSGSTPDAFVLPPPIDADHTVDAPPPREVHMETQSLQAGELVEALMTGGSMDRAIIHLTAPIAELDWNIHAHPGGSTVVVHEELNVMTVEFDFIPGGQADWFLLLRNSGPTNMDIEVKVDLYGDMTFGFI